jgi:hypothetical protein
MRRSLSALESIGKIFQHCDRDRGLKNKLVRVEAAQS